MQVKRTNLSPTKFRLTIVADTEFLQKAKEVTLKHLAAEHVKLPGFRQGKAPLNLIEKNVDQNLLQQEFLDQAVNKLYVQVVRAENLKPVANPQINLKKFVPFTQLEFEAEIEAIGDIKLANYKNLKIAKNKALVTDKDIKEVLASLQQRLSERNSVDRVSKEGDEVTIDFDGSDSKGEPVNGANGQDYPIIIGSNTFIPGFEPNLVGLKSGEEKTFAITFPKDYGVKTLQSKKVTFKIKVKDVKEVVPAKLDDALASKAGPFKTLVELKTDIKQQLKAEREAETERDYENRLVNDIASKSTLAIPDALIDEQVIRAEKAEKQNIAYRGQTWQEHLREEGITEEEHRKRNRPDAEANVKAGLILNEIAETEKITITSEELEVRIKILKGQYTDTAMQSELDNPDNRREIEGRLLTEKTLAKIKSYAAK